MYSENLYTLFTNIFLHAGWMHLIGNMVFLWVFGDNVEIVIGRFKFLIFYILGGVLASYMHCLFNQYSDIPCIGASGAIAACLGAYLVMFPKSKIKIFFILFFTSFRISAVLFLGIWILQQFMNGLGQFYTYTDNVAYWAHIGGFVYGTVIGIIVRPFLRILLLYSLKSIFRSKATFCGLEGFRSLYFCVTGRYDSHFTTRPILSGRQESNLLTHRSRRRVLKTLVTSRNSNSMHLLESMN